MGEFTGTVSIIPGRRTDGGRTMQRVCSDQLLEYHVGRFVPYLYAAWVRLYAVCYDLL